MSENNVHEQLNKPLVNYVRTHRRKTGLTQRDLAKLLGYDAYGVIARHERFDALPSLVKALSYEVLFQTQISEIFTGLSEIVEVEVEARLTEFESHLGKQSARGPQAAAIARKLEWLSERRNSELA